MRVVYVGSFAQPWATESYVAHELELLGHEVIRAEASRVDLELLAHAGRRSQLLLMQGSQIPDDRVVDVWRNVEQYGCVTAGYHLDVFRGLKRADRIKVEPFWRMQHVFSADGDPTTHEWLAEHVPPVNHHWLPAACVSDECIEGFWSPELAVDVLFVGSRNYHAEWPWRRQLLATLQRNYGRRLRIVDGNAVRGRQLNDLYRSAKVVVGDSLCLPGHRNYWSDRYYETLGRGGFLVAPYVPGIEEHFTDRLHLAFYEAGDPVDMMECIEHYLAQPDYAHEIALSGQAHVRAHHTYRHRVLELLRVVGFTDPHTRCVGCGAIWYGDEVTCSCADGDPHYEEWVEL